MNTAIPNQQTNTLRVYGLHTGFARTELAFEGRAGCKVRAWAEAHPPGRAFDRKLAKSSKFYILF